MIHAEVRHFNGVKFMTDNKFLYHVRWRYSLGIFAYQFNFSKNNSVVRISFAIFFSSVIAI